MQDRDLKKAVEHIEHLSDGLTTLAESQAECLKALRESLDKYAEHLMSIMDGVEQESTTNTSDPNGDEEILNV